MFKKQRFTTQMFIKTKQNKQKMFTDKLYLQNKQTFTYTICLQNKNKIKSLQTSYVYKTKVYKHVMFTKQKQMFTNTLCLLNKNVQVSYVYKTKQRFTYKLYLQNKIQNRKFTKQK